MSVHDGLLVCEECGATLRRRPIAGGTMCSDCSQMPLPLAPRKAPQRPREEMMRVMNSQGFSSAQIAEALSVSEGTVIARLAAARKRGRPTPRGVR